MCQKQLNLVDQKSAFNAGIKLHGSLRAMEEFVSNAAAVKMQQYNNRVSKAISEGEVSATSRFRRPRTEDDFDGEPGNPRRFMAIVRAPCLKLGSGGHVNENGNIRNGKHHKDW